MPDQHVSVDDINEELLEPACREGGAAHDVGEPDHPRQRGRRFRPRAPDPALWLDEELDQPAGREFLDSQLYQILYHNNSARNGTWIPLWLFLAVGASEARAAVLAEILKWFEPARSDERRKHRFNRQLVDRRLVRARARVYDNCGTQWYAASVRQMGGRTMLPASTVYRAVAWLEARGFIEVHDTNGRSMQFRPNAQPLAKAYYEITQDEIALTEFLDADAATHFTEWTGSRTQAAACHGGKGAVGVTVHNILLPAVAGKRLLARLLSQILYYFGDRKRVCRARTQLAGRRWWWTRIPRLAATLGISHDTAKRGVKALRKMGFIFTLMQQKKLPGDRQPRLCLLLRPDIENIESGLGAVLEANPDLQPERGDSNDA